MQDGFLTAARRLAEQSDSPVRAAAFLRMARAESAGNIAHARRTLLEALEQIHQLPNPNREYLLEEAREVAAAVAPDLLSGIPIGPRPELTSGRVAQIMLLHGHVDAAFGYLLHYADSASFPFLYVGNVLQHIDSRTPEGAARRLALLHRAADAWRANRGHPFERQEFIRLFAYYWKEFPAEEALTLAHRIVHEALTKEDTRISATYSNEINFHSQRQHHLFEVLHVLRVLDPPLAQSLVESQDQLAASVRRFPEGLETLRAEMAAEVERRRAAGATCEGGYAFSGNPADFHRQRAAVRSGDFGPWMNGALEKHQKDTSPATRNYAPKEHWPSTGEFRKILYQAGTRLGPEAAKLLEQIEDPDLRLFATIELAAALAGVPESSIVERRQPNSPEALQRRMANFRLLANVHSSTDGPFMRSPGGHLIRCPKCRFQPPPGLRWTCNCGNLWNTFATAGQCPSCQFQWQETQCPYCGEMSEHRAWYVIATEAVP